MTKDPFDKSYIPTPSELKKLEPQVIDASDPNNLSAKVLPERQFRPRLLSYARAMGCEREVLICLGKYEKLMKNCPDEKERADIGKLGVLEIFGILGHSGDLYIDGQLVWQDKNPTTKNKIII